MESTKSKAVTVTLVLNEEEADWLKSVVQNPFPTDDNPECNPTLESKEDFKIRKRFWEALV